MGCTSSERERETSVGCRSVGLKDIYTHRLFFKKKQRYSLSLLVKNKSLKLLLQLFHLCLCLNLLFMSKVFFPFPKEVDFPRRPRILTPAAGEKERETISPIRICVKWN